MPVATVDRPTHAGIGSTNPSKKASSGTTASVTSFDVTSPGTTIQDSNGTGGLPQDTLSPLRSDDGWGTPPKTSPSIDVSMMAKHGSGPPSPVLKGLGLGLKDSGYFQLPWPKGARSQSEELEEAGGVRPSKLTTRLDAAKEEGEEDVAAAVADGEKPQGKKNMRVIAVDFDDVCAQYMPTIVMEHNARYGTNMTVEDMQTYCFFQCRGWGTPAEVARKMEGLDLLLPQSAPVPGFADGLRALHALGHPLHIVTARGKLHEEAMIEWLAEQGISVGIAEDDVIAAIWFTNAYASARTALPEKGSTASAVEREKELNDQLKEVWKEGVGAGKGGKSKLRVLRAINAALFIDDHHGNLEPIISADPPVPCLLFGKYAWNRSRSGIASPVELMSYDERRASGLVLPLQEIEMVENLSRAETWENVVAWVKEWDVDAEGS